MSAEHGSPSGGLDASTPWTSPAASFSVVVLIASARFLEAVPGTSATAPNTEDRSR